MVNTQFILYMSMCIGAILGILIVDATPMGGGCETRFICGYTHYLSRNFFIFLESRSFQAIPFLLPIVFP